MGREQDLYACDHKVLGCPQNPEKQVDAWLSDNRLVLMTIDSPVDPTTATIIGSATISIPLLDFNRSFQCPGCIGNGCDVILGSATKAKEIPGAFQSIEIVPVPIEELPPV